MNWSIRKELFLELKKLRSQKRLHTFVERQLIQLLAQAVPDYLPVKEPQGLAGGRNDVIAFAFHGRKVVFEIFATKSQVSRDLLILNKTKADAKICIVIDQEIDTGVWEQIQKENPEDNYPFVFTQELFLDDLRTRTLLKLRELITGEEEALFQRLVAERISVDNYIAMWRSEGLSIVATEILGATPKKYQSVFNLELAKRLLKLGMMPEHVKELIRWFSDENLAESVLMRIGAGHNLLLYTDLNDNMVVVSDREILDFIKCFHRFDGAVIILSLNNIVVSIIKTHFAHVSPADQYEHIGFTIGTSDISETNEGRLVTLGLPSNTKRITILRPWNLNESAVAWNEKTSDEDIFKMIDIV